MRAHVGNHALKPLFAKMYSNKDAQNDILREIALLPARGAWSWQLLWVPRGLNAAAGALSKIDMEKFKRLQPRATQMLQVSDSHMRPPSLELLCEDDSGGAAQGAEATSSRGIAGVYEPMLVAGTYMVSQAIALRRRRKKRGVCAATLTLRDAAQVSRRDR